MLRDNRLLLSDSETSRYSVNRIFQAELVHFFHEFGSENETFDFWDIRADFFRIIGETDIFYLRSFFESDFSSFDREFSRELDAVARTEYISEGIGNHEGIWHRFSMRK